MSRYETIALLYDLSWSYSYRKYCKVQINPLSFIDDRQPSLRQKLELLHS